MIQGPGFIREMRAGEEPAVGSLLRLAFEGEVEAVLVNELRKDGAMAGESVLPVQDRIIGYYALSEFISPKGWLCLAPVAIHPDVQRQGHGRRMIGQLTEWARISGRYIVVLGQPEFYGCAGFSLARAARLHSPYPITHTLLAGPGDDAPELQLQYPAAFGRI